MDQVAALDATGRRAAVTALGAGAGALAVALLAPRAFSDPVGVDPFEVRLALVAAALLGTAFVLPALADARAALLGLVGLAAPWTVWLATPRAAAWAFPSDAGDSLTLCAGALYLLATLAVLVLAWRSLPASRQPALRLRRFGPAAAIAAVAGVALFLLVVFALPATLLGREGLALVALRRSLPLAGPAVALQGAAQELQLRGLLLGVLERVMPRWQANVGQALVFGLAHMAVQYEGPAAPFIPLTVALGLLLGWVTQRTGSLWPAIVVHAVAEVAALAVLPGLYGY